MAEREVSARTVQSLAAKIKGLDLSVEEKAVFDDIVARAGMYDTRGTPVERTVYNGLASGADLGGGLSLRIGVAVGHVLRPPGWPPAP